MVLMFLKHGARITPFIRPWLTMTNKKSWPEDGGRSVIRSTESCLNRRSMDKGIEESEGYMG